MTKNSIFIYLQILLFAGFFLLPTVSNPQPQSNAEADFQYNLAKPDNKWELPDELKEVSGIAWLDRDHFIAIENFNPLLYYIRAKHPVQIRKKIEFKETKKKKFDIEDVTFAGNNVYALWSHGEIFRIKNWLGEPEVKKYETKLDKDNNTEGLCYDPVSGNLLIACKEKSDLKDEKKSTRAVFEFDLEDKKLKKKPFLLIEKKDFEKLGYKDLDFYPSAIAIHQSTHDVYVLSTRENKCLARYSYEGKILSLQFIDKDLMPQPEGLSFSKDNSLYISTQGRNGKRGTIYEFKSIN